MGETAKDQAKGAPLGRGTGEETPEGGVGGTEVGEKAVSSPLLTPTAQPGPEPWA